MALETDGETLNQPFFSHPAALPGAREQSGATLIAPEEFLALYDTYFPRLYNYIRYRCSDPDLADDLTAAVFEQALSKLGDFDPVRGSLGAWLFGIGRNAVNYHLRSSRRSPRLSLDVIAEHSASDHPSPEDELIQVETRHELLAAIETIPERERDLLSLKFAARLTNRRIAEVTGLSESNVGVILHRAVEKLRLALRKE